MLRLFLFILLVYFILRWLSRLRTPRKSQARAGKRTSYAQSPPRPAAPPRAIDEMKPCAACGAYVPTRLALKKNELYFCSQQCQEASLTKKRDSVL